MNLLLLALFLVVVGGMLIWLARHQRRSAGLPGGQLIYVDTRQWGEVEEPLYHAGLGLTGKPDYLVRQGNTIIPVEVKTGRLPQAPFDGHIYQLAAYCLLVERVYHVRPPFGILHYTKEKYPKSATRASRTYTIPYTPELEDAILELLIQMQRDLKRRDLPRSHSVVGRCRSCGYQDRCDQQLG